MLQMPLSRYTKGVREEGPRDVHFALISLTYVCTYVISELNRVRFVVQAWALRIRDETDALQYIYLSSYV